MKRKHDASSFQKCVGLGVSDAAVRAILKRLHNTGESSQKSENLEKRFPELLPCLQSITIGNAEIFVTDLEKYLSLLGDRCPAIVSAVEKFVLPQMSREQNEIPGILYLDECTPGNPIRPDNERRSWCVYFTWLPLALLRKEAYWFPVSVLRTDEGVELEGGVANYMKQILLSMEPFFIGCRIGAVMIPTSQVFLLADEAALKLASSSKGASGLKPCLKCQVLSRDRRDVEGYVSICEPDPSRFPPRSEAEVLASLRFLLDCKRQGMAKTKLQKYETLAGCHADEYVWLLDEKLRARMPWSHVLYDPMHVLWNNGIICQEVAYFFDRASILVSNLRENLVAFLQGWKPTRQLGGAFTESQLKKLISKKLLRRDCDYKGDANQTLELLPLLTFYGEKVLLPIHPTLGPETKSLTALCDVANQVLDAKQRPLAAEDLTCLVTKHVRAFLEVYTPDHLRPKHHYACHLQGCMAETKACVDCWVCERKNKTFKAKIAPNLKRLTDFSKSALIRFLEIDLHRMTETPLVASTVGLSKEYVDIGGDLYKVAREIKHNVFGNVRIGDFVLCDEETAFKVLACLQTKKDDTFFLLLQCLLPLEAGNRMRWSNWRLTDRSQVLPLECVNLAMRSSWALESEETVCILR